MLPTPKQIGKSFVVQYYRVLYDHPEELHRFYSSLSTFTHDDPNKTVTGLENISKRIDELSYKHRHVRIRQVDSHSTVNNAVVVQVCGEISSSVTHISTPFMRRFVQTFILAPTNDLKQKYYVHNDIFRYQDAITISNDHSKTKLEGIPGKIHSILTERVTRDIVLSTPMNEETPKNDMTNKDEKSKIIPVSTLNLTPPETPVHIMKNIEEKEQVKSSKISSSAVGKKEKATIKSGKTKSPKSSNRKIQTTFDYSQKNAEYYDDSWYYEADGENYLYTGYIDDQEIFVGNLSTQIKEEEIHDLFRSYGRLLFIRVGNTGSQIGKANFAFVVCQSIEMAKEIVNDREKLLQSHQIDVQVKKRRPFAHTFRPTYPTAACPTTYRSVGYPSASSFHNGIIGSQGTQRKGKPATH